MASNNFKTPPTLSKTESYEHWEKSVQLWQLVTDIPKKKRGAAVVLALEGKDREVALELSIAEINSDDGVEKILDKLGNIYKKDTVDTAYEKFEEFVSYKRSAEVNINFYIQEFERRYLKAKEHGCELSSSVLAYFLLKQAQLSDSNNKLVRATVTKLEFEDMKSQLKKVFGSGNEDQHSDINKVKIEDINVSEECEEVMYGRYAPRPYYNNQRGMRRGVQNRGATGVHRPYTQYRGASSSSGQQRGRFVGPHQFDKQKVRCHICESIFHKSYECPDRTYYGECEDEDAGDHEVVLYQSGLLTENQYQIFVAESSASAILDSGASATVAGRVWLDSYCAGLSEQQLGKVKYYDSTNSFKFGSDKKYESLCTATIPAKIGSKRVQINTDVIDTNIPLLLSKAAMKRAGTEINFVNDEVTMFGERQNVHITTSGHYAIPLNDSRVILKDIKENSDLRINLVVGREDMEDKRKIALKLHSQFGHPPKSKLVKLLERAGLKEDTLLIQEIERVETNCSICKEFKKPSPTPAVGLPHATTFNEMVAIDLKFFEGRIILHMIDHLTRFSSAAVIKSKEPKEIVNGIVKCWIGIFGPPQKILSDNGGEFASPAFIELAESMNIRVLTTAAYSPWSNGLVERHNATLSEMLHKIMAERRTDLDIALAWAVQAKNGLANVHGFSPAQLTLGYNPQLPGVLNNKLPALEERTSVDIVAEHLNCMSLAREAFMRAESSERIKRALKRNIRPSAHNKFFNGDRVFYKRNDSRKWKGPGIVIGSESSNILIKHGPHYVRVHACRVMLDKRKEDEGYTGNGENLSGDGKLEPANGTGVVVDEQSDSDSGNGNGSNVELSDGVVCGDRNVTRGDAVGPDTASDRPQGQQPRVRKGLRIEFKRKDGDWETGEVLRRSGKSTGKYKDHWYINCDKTGESEEFNIVADLEDFRVEGERDEEEFSHDTYLVEEVLKAEILEEVAEAKKLEVDKWIEEKVFVEVPDEGQERLSTTWVITTKKKESRMVTKARLVVRGYEETGQDIRSDSPTCMKENVRMLLAIAVARGWTINSLDVKAAFLQGKHISRRLFVTPPKEFRKDNIIWKLNKVVYGLCDASRSWYLRVCEVLLDLGMCISNCDKAVFTYRKRSLEGILLIHVDDILYFGSEEFVAAVVEPFKSEFQISRQESTAFKYLGMDIKQNSECVELDQNEYARSLTPCVLPKEALLDKFRFADDKERRIFKQAVGQLGWLTGVSRPEAAFMYCMLSTRQGKPQMQDFSRINKVIKELQGTSSRIRIGRMDLHTIRVSVFSDASFGNLEGGASQIGYITFVHDARGHSVPVAWASKKARRVARSTLTAHDASRSWYLRVCVL